MESVPGERRSFFARKHSLAELPPPRARYSPPPFRPPPPALVPGCTAYERRSFSSLRNHNSSSSALTLATAAHSQTDLPDPQSAPSEADSERREAV